MKTMLNRVGDKTAVALQTSAGRVANSPHPSLIGPSNETDHMGAWEDPSLLNTKPNHSDSAVR